MSRIVALIYTGGTVAHVLRLILGFGWQDMPFFPDWAIVLLGTAGVLGLVRTRDAIAYRGRWERLTHWLIVLHLGVSVAVHIRIVAVNSHRVLAVFPRSYSYAAALYFAFFAWRSWTTRSLEATARHEGGAVHGTAPE